MKSVMRQNHVVFANDGNGRRFYQTVLVWPKRVHDRRFLMAQNDRLLLDIGLSGADVKRKFSKPFWKSQGDRAEVGKSETGRLSQSEKAGM